MKSVNGKSTSDAPSTGPTSPSMSSPPINRNAAPNYSRGGSIPSDSQSCIGSPISTKSTSLNCGKSKG